MDSGPLTTSKMKFFGIMVNGFRRIHIISVTFVTAETYPKLIKNYPKITTRNKD